MVMMEIVIMRFVAILHAANKSQYKLTPLSDPGRKEYKPTSHAP